MRLEIRCPECRDPLGVFEDGIGRLIVNRGSNREPRMGKWIDGVAYITCCGVTRIYREQNGAVVSETVVQWANKILKNT